MLKESNNFISTTLVAAVAFAALALGVAGCGGDDGDGDVCYDYAGFDGTSTTVAFQADVLPILRNSCGLSGACHGMESGPAGQPFLGPATSAGAATQAQVDAIFAQNVGVNATKASTMKIVDPGNPQTSFLMHKMDNTLTCPDVKCEAGCGGSMPLGSAMLGADQRDKVRRWIAQGAKND